MDEVRARPVGLPHVSGWGRAGYGLLLFFAAFELLGAVAMVMRHAGGGAWTVDVGLFGMRAEATSLPPVTKFVYHGPGPVLPLLVLGALALWQWVAWRRTRYTVGATHLVVEPGLSRRRDLYRRTGAEQATHAGRRLTIERGPGREPLVLHGVSAADAEALRAALARPLPEGSARAVAAGPPLVFARAPTRGLRAAQLGVWAVVLFMAVVLVLPGTAAQVLLGDRWPGQWRDLSELFWLIGMLVVPSAFDRWSRARFVTCVLEAEQATFTLASIVSPRGLELRFPLTDLRVVGEAAGGLKVEAAGRSRWAAFWAPLVVPARGDEERAQAVARLEGGAPRAVAPPPGDSY